MVIQEGNLWTESGLQAPCVYSVCPDLIFIAFIAIGAAFCFGQINKRGPVVAGPPDAIHQIKGLGCIASIGCEMRFDSDYLPVELQAGLTREQTQTITSYMLATDRAVKLPEGGVRLTTGACA